MRRFVPECFKHKGCGHAMPINPYQSKRRKQRIVEIRNNAKAGNSHMLIFPKLPEKSKEDDNPFFGYD